MRSMETTTAHHHSDNNPVDLLWEALKLRQMQATTIALWPERARGKNAFENVVSEMAAILFKGRWVNGGHDDVKTWKHLPHYWPIGRGNHPSPVDSPREGPAMWISGPSFNIKMSSYQYRKSHSGDNTILWPSYLHNGIFYTGKTTSLYWIGVLVLLKKAVEKIVGMACHVTHVRQL